MINNKHSTPPELDKFFLNSDLVKDFLVEASKPAIGFSEVDKKLSGDSERKMKIHSDFSDHALFFAKQVGRRWIAKEEKEAATRKILAIILIVTLILFLLSTIAVVALQGIEGVYFQLTDAAFGAFLGVFAVNFIGLVVIIFNYFYSERSTKSLEVIKDFIVEMCKHNRQYGEKD